jgi:hypothetical protein
VAQVKVGRAKIAVVEKINFVIALHNNVPFLIFYFMQP